jgi:hypothetical protein
MPIFELDLDLPAAAKHNEYAGSPRRAMIDPAPIC